MTEISFARQLAQHVTGDHTLNDEITDWMKLLLLDYYAVTTGGVERSSAIAARSAVQTSTNKTPFHTASLHGTDLWATPEDAALVNGITAHGLELDDTFEESSLHPAVAVFPAVLALADERGESARSVLHAAAIGYDVMCNAGVLLGAAESYGRGFHPTGIAGVLGVAAAIAALLKLDEDESTHALGLAANLAAGSLEFLSDGSWTKRLNAGHAAASGIRAAKLAAAGFTAPETSIEGRDGFLKQYGRGLVSGRGLDLVFGKSALNTSIKFYPCCRYMHGNIDLLRDIHTENPGLEIEDIESIQVGVIKAGATLVSEPPARKLIVTSAVDAQFSMPFGAAVALTTGQATVEQFDNATAIAVKLAPWLKKVKCYTSERLEAAFPVSWQAEVSIRFKDGSVIERSEDAFRGAPQDRATRDQLVAKAARLLTPSAAGSLDSSIAEMHLDSPLPGQVTVPQKASL